MTVRPLAPPRLDWRAGIEGVLRRYPGLDPVAGPYPCRYGNEARVVELRTARGPVVVKAQPLPGGDIVAEGLVLGALHAAGCPVPCPLVTVDGERSPAAAGWRWLLLTRLDGVHLRSGRYPPGVLRRLGGELARVHRALAAAPGLANRTARGAAYLHEVADLVRRHPGADVGRAGAFRRAYEEVVPLLGGPLAGLRPGPVHSDVSFDNVVVGRRVQLIDFGDAGRGTPLFDVATALLHICADGHRLRPAAVRALLAGYVAVEPALVDELPALTDALRFVCVRKQASYLNYRITRAQILRKNLTFFGKYDALRAGSRYAAGIAGLAHDVRIGHPAEEVQP
jgi:Ser/Thr protein kinase RdoA (MazF antagonist)